MKHSLNTVLYYFLRGLFWSFSLLPFHFLYYPFADLAYFVIYKLIRYRVGVTRDNLANAFPEKNEQERMVIEKKFYHHFAEVFIDTLTLTGVSERVVRKRITYDNTATYNDRSWICAMAHYGSWEYAVGYAKQTDNLLLPAYRPLYNKPVDLLMHHARSRFGAEPVAMNNVIKKVIECNRIDRKFVLALIADQTPPWYDRKYWYTFLNQDTTFFQGMGKIATKYKLPILFLNVKKIKRGYYTASFEEIYNGTDNITIEEITSIYAKHLEQAIRECPELWMWSHKRWKHHRQ